MVTWGKHYRVFVDGQWVWFDDYEIAARVEAEQLYGKVKQKLAAGQQVILSLDMWRQVEQVQDRQEASKADKTR